MEEETNDKITKGRKKGRLIRISGSIFLVLAFLQAIFYFGSDFLLRNYLQEKVRIASDEKYEIEFDRFFILFIQRGIVFEGLNIIPIEENIKGKENTAYYKIGLPDIRITGINYLFGKRELVFGNIEVTNPSIDFSLKIEDIFEQQELEDSPLNILQEEIKKSFLGSRINEIRIKALKINEADVLLNNFIAQRRIKAENTNFYLEDIQLLQTRNPLTPLNAVGFDFDFENFEILLADSVHTVFAEKVKISSLDQYVTVQDLKIIPDFNQYSDAYFQLDLKDLRLEDADINKVFYTSQVEVGSLKLQKPEFVHYVRKKSKIDAVGEKQPFDLYHLIEGILSSIEVSEFEIENGIFSQRNVNERDGYRINAVRIDLNMADFYIGPDESKKRNQFFYADQAMVELHHVDLVLGDSVHHIKSEFVRLSSQEDVIKIEGFKLFPTLGKVAEKGVTILDFDVPHLSITDANLKKIYNEGIIDVKSIMVESPEILLRDLQEKRSDQDESFDISSIYADYLDAIYVKKFEIRDGSLVVDNKLRSRQDSLSFGKINLILENFAIDRQTENADTRSFFWAENLQLELEDYLLKLADNLHVFKADKVFLDTKTSAIKVDGFTIRPHHTDDIKNILDRYGKSTALDIFVPQFYAKGVDITSAYFDEILKVNSITVPSPEISIYRYTNLPPNEDGEKVDQRELLQLLINYFKEVEVASLVLERGNLNYEDFGADRMQAFYENDFSISIKKFRINEDSAPEELKFLFSQEVDLNLNNYVFNIADGKYNILADRINFNSAREEILASNVRLNPGRIFKDRTRVTAVIPEMSLQGVDLEAFLFDNTLNLEKVRLSGSDVQVLINKDLGLEDIPASRRQRRERNLPKTIDVVEIDTIQAEKAQLSLAFREGGVQSELINTGIDLSFYGFKLDSAIVSKSEITGLFDAMSLDIDEFWLTLADSVHQITFSKVELDTRYEGVLVDNFRIIPRDLSGKPGKPVFSGHIPTALIKTKSLSEIQSSKDLWISEFRLFRPDIEIFVDQVKSESKPGEIKEPGTEIIENLQIDDFEIIEGNIAMFQKDGSAEPKGIKKLNLSLEDLKFNISELEAIREQDLLRKKFKLDFPDFQLLLKDSLNKVSIGLVTVSNEEIRMENLEYLPRYGKYQYGRIVGEQTDVVQIKVPLVIISKPDLDKLFEEEKLLASKILILDADGEFFRDKRYQRPKNVLRPMPQALMKKAGIELKVDTLLVENSQIRYMEFPEQGMVPGQLYFNELSASLIPFHTSIDEKNFLLEESLLLANAKINGRAEISLQGQLFYEFPYPMKINAQLGAFDLESINSILKPNAFVKVREGRVNSADWSFVANDRDAVGSMEFLYNDLNLELLDERTLEKGRGRKGILTFVLNVFAVRSNNPRKFLNTKISSKIYYPRDKERFIFNYWWKTTVTGLKGSVGLGQPKIPKRKEED
ncbi:hypothetical protein [Shivajiella indica]|uniref:DUF748 domain-containing protein n=1 Tax=Shivajiella indica TaxID=872115 RepID=A0ABW5B573_9BACT